jgi:small subunit ribosomal protein S21
MQREGVFREIRRRRFYEKPSERSNRKQAEAIRRARKLARKKAQREGLIAAPRGKKVPPGRATARRGPFSVARGVRPQS